MAKKYIVTLSTEECEALQKLIACGTARARKLTHARILLKAHAGWSDPAISVALEVSITTTRTGTPVLCRRRAGSCFEPAFSSPRIPS